MQSIHISIKSSRRELQFQYKFSYTTKSLPQKKWVSRGILNIVKNIETHKIAIGDNFMNYPIVDKYKYFGVWVR